jgi:hypothetical protein
VPILIRWWFFGKLHFLMEKHSFRSKNQFRMKRFFLTASLGFGLLGARQLLPAQTNLECVGFSGDASKHVCGVAVAGHYLFAAGGNDGLRIFDISNPTNLVCVGHTNNSENAGNAMGIAVCGDYAYVANSNDGMRIYDVSDPTRPVCVGHAPEIAMAASFGIAVLGITEFPREKLFGKRKTGAHYAFLANYNDGLRIYDVSNPADPKRLAHLNDGGTALDATVSSNSVYLANDYDGLRIYDISNPAKPICVGCAHDMGYPWGVVVVGKYAYVADNFHGFTIFDISNPTNSVVLGNINNSPPKENFLDHISGKNKGKVFIQGSAYGVAVAGHHAYIANFQDGVWAYDISCPTNPIPVAHTGTNYGGFSKRLVVSGGYAYVANQDDGIRVYRVFDDNPVLAKASAHYAWIYFVVMLFVLILASFVYWRRRMKDIPQQN